MALLQNKTVIITGAGAGLGEGIARVCHREGANIVIADVRGDAAAQVADSLQPRALAVACDVSNSAQLRQLVDATVKRFSRIDGLVNNAGINFLKPFLETTMDHWDRILAVDLRAVFELTQLVCRRMLDQNPPGGSVVNISSVHSVAALAGAGPYDAAKWGVVGLTKSLAVELGDRGIRLNAVSPGLINTMIWREALAKAADPQACIDHWNANTPLNRVLEPEEIGELVAFLLSDRASAITGANYLADGGITAMLTSKPNYRSKPLGDEVMKVFKVE